MSRIPRSLALMLVLWHTCAWIPAGAQDLPELFKKVAPSVVIIGTKQKELQPMSGGKFVTAQGLGSGVLISADGKVMTAAHVVQAADKVRVAFPGDTVAEARVIASEPAADVALLQIDRLPEGAVVAKLGDSDQVEVGDEIFVVGAPFGISHTLTVGHISARHEPNSMLSGVELAEFFQTDAAINQGNSGGPMFNQAGEVIGIVSHILTFSGGFEGLGFVVTSNMARRLLLEEGSFWSGVEGYRLSGEMAKVLNVPQSEGMLVLRVAENSPASKAGLEGGTVSAVIEGQSVILGGDIVLDVMGIPIGEEGARDRIQAELKRRQELGQLVKLTVLRGGKRVELSTVLP